MGEFAEDGGGPCREFWILLAKEVASTMFTGLDYRLVPIHDVVGLQVRVYKRLHLAVIYMSAYTNFSIMVLNT